jgi:hypothetical protein
VGGPEAFLKELNRPDLVKAALSAVK